VSTALSEDVAVVQALEFLNGEEFNTRVTSGKLLAELSQERDPARIIERAYWSLYSHPPTAAELQAGRQFLAAGNAAGGGGLQLLQAPAPPSEAIADLLWALVVNPEFQYIR